jgi:mono/diheme cytochrome c family protein
VTEVPEHLLARSQARRAALGLGGDAPAAAAAPAAADSSPAVAASAAPAAAAAKAPAKAAPAAPLPPPPPEPYVQAALDRRRIPYWAMPVLGFLPLWGLIYVQTLEPPPSTEPTVLEHGGELYALNCSACHGPTGGGGPGRKLSDGDVVATFPNLLDHVQFVQVGSAGIGPEGTPYGDPEREGGQRTTLSYNTNPMPAFANTFSDEDIIAIVRYEREVLSGEEYEPAQIGELDALLDEEGLEVFHFDDAGNLITEEGDPVFSETGYILPGMEAYLESLTDVPATVYPELAEG